LRRVKLELVLPTEQSADSKIHLNGNFLIAVEKYEIKSESISSLQDLADRVFSIETNISNKIKIENSSIKNEISSLESNIESKIKSEISSLESKIKSSKI